MNSSCWKVPPLWKDSYCWIIGGGPSILNQFGVPKDVSEQIQTRKIPLSILATYMGGVLQEHCIGINNAYIISDYIDFTFFGDYGWYLVHQKELEKHPSTKVSCNAKFGHRYYGVKYLRKKHYNGVANKNGCVCWNKNSGAAGINFAYHLGVKEIRLLGFDMDVDVNNHTHWHGYHAELARAKPKPTRHKGKINLPYNRHLKCFPDIARDADNLGIKILNCNPNSQIQAFEKVSVAELIK